MGRDGAHVVEVVDVRKTPDGPVESEDVLVLVSTHRRQVHRDPDPL